ncbi:TetR/AcrR family transcriptional regulator [Novosphingobium sp. BL-8A]|uniref:TetR/AcrR family transcriptional regulator n=1 Tax=Novosphingobium sp. BL-8A TaxID=3127639 RepID=UPI0037569BEC
MRTRMNREDRRAAILDTAIAVIGERGFHGFSIRDLAMRCAMTDAGLLHHFGSKTDLLLAVLDHRDAQDEEAIAALFPADAPPRTRAEVLRVFAAVVARNAERPELVRLYAMLRVEALAPDHPAHAYFTTRDRLARRRFAEILGPLSDSPDRLARQVVSAMDGLELQWLQEDRAFDLMASWNETADRLIA